MMPPFCWTEQQVMSTSLRTLELMLVTWNNRSDLSEG